MRLNSTKQALLPAIFLLFGFNAASAQKTEAELSATIIGKDSLFWQYMNNCDTLAIKAFFSDDIEFYHDKGGATFGFAAFYANTQKNLCSATSGFRMRRAAVPGSLTVFPMHKDGVLYGAILSGEHVFYVRENNGTEHLDGRAKFTHLWILKEGSWKMTRVLSYNHGPANR